MESTQKAIDMKINSEDEFHNILQDMYDVEECFEGMHSWVGSVLSEEYRELLTILADDSNEHRKRLDTLISKIDGFKLKEKRKNKLDFKEDLEDKTILNLILENDHSALYNYSILKTKVDKEFLSKIMDEKDIPDYYETLDSIIEDELKHIKMLRTALE